MTILPDTHLNQGNNSHSWITFSNLSINWCSGALFRFPNKILEIFFGSNHNQKFTPELSIPETALEYSASVASPRIKKRPIRVINTIKY